MKLKALKEKQDKLIGELELMVSNLEENGEVRSLTVEERDAFNAKKVEVDNITSTIRAIEEARALATSEEAVVELKEERSKEAVEKRALENFFRGQDLMGEERAILASANTALIPLEISKTIMKKLEEQCPILDRAKRFSSKGTLILIKEESYGNAQITAENAGFHDSDASFGTVELKAYKVTCQVKATFEMLQNSEIDLTAYLMEVIVKRLSRELNKLFLVGNGSNQPQGLTKEGIEHEISASGITINDFITMQTKVNPEYLNGACWIVGRETFTKMANLLDGAGRPYLLSNYDAVSNKIQYTFLGLPVVVDNFMPELSNGNVAVVMANIGEAYAINVLTNITVKHLQEVGFTQGYEVFAGYCMVDGKIVNGDAIVLGKVED